MNTLVLGRKNGNLHLRFRREHLRVKVMLALQNTAAAACSVMRQPQSGAGLSSVVDSKQLELNLKHDDVILCL